MLELPNELLLEVARSLEGDNGALAALTRTCQRMKPITEGIMYKSFILPRGIDHKAACLVRTLLEKPRLAVQVSKLSMTLTLCVVSTAPECALSLKRVPVYHDTIQAIRAHFESLGMTLPNAWIEEAITGYITSLALCFLLCFLVSPIFACWCTNKIV
jgi:hypothetical protein